MCDVVFLSKWLCVLFRLIQGSLGANFWQYLIPTCSSRSLPLSRQKVESISPVLVFGQLVTRLEQWMVHTLPLDFWVHSLLTGILYSGACNCSAISWLPWGYHVGRGPTWWRCPRRKGCSVRSGYFNFLLFQLWPPSLGQPLGQTLGQDFCKILTYRNLEKWHGCYYFKPLCQGYLWIFLSKL